MYLPFSSGNRVEKGDSLVDVIKDIWSIPVHIPYASELKVEDGAPVTQEVKLMQKVESTTSSLRVTI